MLEFLLQSQSLLTICLEDYWAAYDKSSERLKITDSGASLATSFVGCTIATKVSVTMEAHEAQREPSHLTTREDSEKYRSQHSLQLRTVLILRV